MPCFNSRRDKVLTVDPSVDYAKVKNVSPETWFTLSKNWENTNIYQYIWVCLKENINLRQKQQKIWIPCYKNWLGPMLYFVWKLSLHFWGTLTFKATFQVHAKTNSSFCITWWDGYNFIIFLNWLHLYYNSFSHFYYLALMYHCITTVSLFLMRLAYN